MALYPAEKQTNGFVTGSAIFSCAYASPLGSRCGPARPPGSTAHELRPDETADGNRIELRPEISGAVPGTELKNRVKRPGNKRRATNQQIIERTAQAIDVGPDVGTLGFQDLFGRDEVGRTQDLTYGGQCGVNTGGRLSTGGGAGSLRVVPRSGVSVCDAVAPF
jgi:hypothetical protein